MKEAPSIPEFNNLYGIVFEADSMLEFTNQLKKRGWICRNSSWTEIEATINWAEIEIAEEGKELILHGAIDSNYFESFGSLMNELDYRYRLEIYNKQKELIKTSTNNS